MKLLKASKTNKAPELDNLPVSGIKRSFRLIHVLLTLDARDFRGFWFRSSLYSDFGRPRNVSAALDRRAREKTSGTQGMNCSVALLVLVGCINLSLISGFFWL